MTEVEVNLRHARFVDAKQAIIDAVEEAWFCENTVLFIHGFNRGTAIRSYIRGGKMEREVKRIIPAIGKIEIFAIDDGSTRIELLS